jgi:hypothetical protein
MNERDRHGADDADDAGEADENVEELAEDAKEENPDLTTRRETLELELMEERRSEEGEHVQLDEDHDHKGGA